MSQIVYKYRDHPSIRKIKSHFGEIENKFEFHHILPEDIFEQVKLLDESTSSGGNIPTKVLKDSVNVYCNYLTDCFNASVNNQKFPDTLKLGDLVPIFKDGDRTNKTNYRPICILPTLSKILERILFKQLSPYMSKMLNKKLCGFRQGYSTQYALMKLLEDWRKHLDNKQVVGVIACDLSKAFDTLPHDLLIAKLEAYGFGYRSLSFILDYLSDRKQRCKIGSSYSLWLYVLAGVPQGSVLGPFLFNIFINDFFLFIEKCDTCNFADDNSLYSAADSLETVVCKLEVDLVNAIHWFRENSMVVNAKKFQFMILGTKRITKICLNIDGYICHSKTSILLLGIHIDWKLSFNNHVNILCTKASSKTKQLFRLRHKLDYSQKLVLFHSYIMSVFSYCSIIWMFCGKTMNARINRVHKRALQALLNDFESSFNELLEKSNQITIHELNKRRLLIEVYRCLNIESPCFLSDLFVPTDKKYNLRKNKALILPKASTKSWGLHSLSYRGSRSWNSLSDEVKNQSSSQKFKENLKKISMIECTCKLCI